MTILNGYIMVLVNDSNENRGNLEVLWESAILKLA